MLEKWLIARPTYIAFAVSAWLMVALGIALAFVFTPLFDYANRVSALQSLLQFAGGLLLVLALPAAVLLLFGMLIFCLVRDPAPSVHRFVWIFLFLFTACFGAALYFFRVYRRERALILRQDLLVYMEQLIPATEKASQQAR